MFRKLLQFNSSSAYVNILTEELSIGIARIVRIGVPKVI